MSRVWDGKSYDEGWNEVDGTGQKTGNTASTADQQAWSAQNPNTPAPQSAAPTPTAPSTTSDWQGLNDQTFGTIKHDMALDGTVDQNDPAFKQQMDANALQTNLAADRSRAAMAQRRAATGTGSSGAVDTDANKVLEQQAYQDKTFEGNLMNQFRQQNLDKQARALQLGSGMLTAEQERDLRGALTREGYTLQSNLAANDLNFRRDALGQQLGISQADMDQRAILSLLGGGGG